jgi:hypothetical protein
MAIPADKRQSYLGRQVGSLAIAEVGTRNSMSLVKAASWHNHLLRLGLALPLFVVHDLGLVLSGNGGLRTFTETGPAGDRGYRQLLSQLSEAELCKGNSSWRMRDDLVAVLLSKLLQGPWQRWSGRRSWVGSEALPLDPGTYANVDTTARFNEFDANPLYSFRLHLVTHRLYLLTAVEQIDLDTLSLLGMFHDPAAAGMVDLADLHNVFSTPEANGVVNFSMDLLPSVLETKRQSGVQTFSIDGYASIERRGGVDAIVLSEFAYEDDIFERKVIDNELYYYGHEKQQVDDRAIHYILVDSSASMRGDRQVFGRGLALTLSKKLSLQGHDVWLRFFDSRLYGLMRVSQNSEAAIPYLLCFRSERGRNYGRVFRQLVGELKRLARDERRQIVVYLITHGQCHPEPQIVEELSQLADIYGVFILPSSGLHLEYLDHLRKYQIVEGESLASREGSVDRAMEIIDDATTGGPVPGGG